MVMTPLIGELKIDPPPSLHAGIKRALLPNAGKTPADHSGRSFAEKLKLFAEAPNEALPKGDQSSEVPPAQARGAAANSPTAAKPVALSNLALPVQAPRGNPLPLVSGSFVPPKVLPKAIGDIEPPAPPILAIPLVKSDHKPKTISEVEPQALASIRASSVQQEAQPASTLQPSLNKTETAHLAAALSPSPEAAPLNGGKVFVAQSRQPRIASLSSAEPLAVHAKVQPQRSQEDFPPTSQRVPEGSALPSAGSGTPHHVINSNSLHALASSAPGVEVSSPLTAIIAEPSSPTSAILLVKPSAQGAVNAHTIASGLNAEEPLSASHYGRDGSEMGEPHTLVSSPRVLEVGLTGGAHGWLRVRAELEHTGEVTASLVASSSGSADVLQKQLGAISAYLKSESVGVSNLAVTAPEKSGASQAFGASSPGGSSPGSGAQNAPSRQHEGESDRKFDRSEPQLDRHATPLPQYPLSAGLLGGRGGSRLSLVV